MRSIKGIFLVGLFVALALGLTQGLPGNVPTVGAVISPVTIDFEGLAECTSISNQFSSQGVAFSLVQGGNPVIGTDNTANLVGFVGSGGNDGPAPSGVNTLTDSFSGSICPSAGKKHIRADFTIPVCSASLILVDFRRDGGGQIGDTATLQAFDALGNLVDSNSFTVAGGRSRWQSRVTPGSCCGNQTCAALRAFEG